MDARAWNERYDAADLVWSAGPNVFIEQEVRDLPAGRAVDLAAGEGRNALWLAGRGWQVTAVDWAESGLARGRAREREMPGQHPITWLRSDVLDWSEPDHYDLAVLAYLQLPAAERRAACRAGYESLRAGGTLLVVAHDRSNLNEGTGGPQDPDVLMDADDVLADLADLGPDVQHAGRRPRTVEPEHGGDPALTAWDCVVRVRRDA